MVLVMFKMLWSVLLIAACVLTVECSNEPVAENKVDYGVAASEIVRGEYVQICLRSLFW